MELLREEDVEAMFKRGREIVATLGDGLLTRMERQLAELSAREKEAVGMLEAASYEPSEGGEELFASSSSPVKKINVALFSASKSQKTYAHSAVGRKEEAELESLEGDEGAVKLNRPAHDNSFA